MNIDDEFQCMNLEFCDKKLFGSTILQQSPSQSTMNPFHQNSKKSYYYPPHFPSNNRVRMMSILQESEKVLQSQKHISQHDQQHGSQKKYQQHYFEYNQMIQKPRKFKESLIEQNSISTAQTVIHRKPSNQQNIKTKLILKQYNQQKPQLQVSQTQRLNIKGIQASQQKLKLFSPNQKEKYSFLKFDKQPSFNSSFLQYKKTDLIDKQSTVEKSELYNDEPKNMKQNIPKQTTILPKIHIAQKIQYRNNVNEKVSKRNVEIDCLSLSGWSNNSHQF